MSVIIHNRGYTRDRSSGRTDECKYAIRINNGPDLAYCKHFRADGLAELLRKMAKALDKQEENRHGL